MVRQATREALLDAAYRVMRDKGVAAATTKEIARAAGVAEGSIYNHFTDKVDLLGAVIVERLPNPREFVGELEARVGRSTVRANLEDFARRAIDFFGQVLPLVGPVLGDPELRAAATTATREHSRGPHRFPQTVAGYLKAEQRVGRIGENVDVDALAYAMVGACHQYAFVTLISGPEALPVPAERFARLLSKALVPALAAAPARDGSARLDGRRARTGAAR